MLRIDVDGHWEPEDFIEVLKGVESLYYKAALNKISLREPPFFWFGRPTFAESLYENIDHSNEMLLAHSRIIAPGHKRLRIARIQYASPGGIDFVGIGEACKAVEGIIDRLIKFFTEREIRKQASERAKIETAIKDVELEKEHESLRDLKIKNARAILDLQRDFPEMSEEFLTTLIAHDQDRLIPRIAERKLIGVRRISGEKPQNDEVN